MGGDSAGSATLEEAEHSAKRGDQSLGNAT